MNVLITGGTGALGLHIAKKLLKKQFNVVLYDLFPREINFIEKERIGKIEVVKGNVLDSERLKNTIEEFEITALIHAAALLSDEKCNTIPAQALKVNTWGTLNVLEVARAINLERIVLLSSGAIYGNRFPGPLAEETIANPGGIYGLSKHLSEAIGLMYSRLYGINVLVVRLAAIYGPGQTFSNHVEQIVKGAVAGIPVNIKRGGDHPREWIYIEDAAVGIVLSTIRKNSYQVYNIGSGVLNNISEVAECVQSYIPEATIAVGKGRLENVHLRGPMSIMRAQNDLGYKPIYTLEKGIWEYIVHEKEKPRRNN